MILTQFCKVDIIKKYENISTKERERNMEQKKVIMGSMILLVLVTIGIILGIWINQVRYHYDIEEITEYTYHLLYIDGQYGVLDKMGNIIVEPEYNMIQIPNPSKAVFICMQDYQAETNGYQVSVRNEKNEAIWTEFESVEPITLREESTTIPYEKSVLKYRKDGKYGLIDYTGKIQIKAEYEDIQGIPYKEGILKVKKGEKYGVMNIKGTMLIPTEYDTIDFDGYYEKETQYQKAGFIVSKSENGKLLYGYYNEKGKKVLDSKFEEIKRITESDNCLLMVWRDGKIGIYQNKKKIVNPIYDEITYDEGNHNYLVEKDRKYGVLNQKGKEILPVEQDSLTLVGEDFVAQKGEETTRYNSKGKKIEDQNALTKWKTENDQYKIVKDAEEKYGIQNEKGETLVKNRYTNLEYLVANYFVASNDNEKVGVINAEGKAEIEFQYDSIRKLENTNLIKATKEVEQQYDLYNADLKLVTTFQGEELMVESVKEYLRIYTKITDVEYYTKDGKKVEAKQVYPNAKLIAKEQDGKWGYIDLAGEKKIDYQYEQVTEMNEYGFAGIKQNGKWGVIREDGIILQEPCYELEENFPEFLGKYYRVLSLSQPYYTDYIEEVVE